MAAVHNYPLIAVTEVFAMPSVDNPTWDGLGPTEEILETKLREVLGGGCDCCSDGGYGWPVDIEFDNPIHLEEIQGERSQYGHRLDSSYIGRKVMGNGHHRLAFQALVQGALFVPYCDTMQGSGW